MNPQPAPKNFALVDTLSQMGFRLCMFGLLGFLGSLLAHVFGYDTNSSSLTFQLLISCWGFSAAGGMLFVGTQFIVGPYKRKKPKSNINAKDIAYQLTQLGPRYRVFNGIDILTPNGPALSYQHIVIGPNGLFHLAPLPQATYAREAALQDMLWAKNVRQLDITTITLPTPRPTQAIQQHRSKRRLSATDVERIATMIENSSRPTQEKKQVDHASPLAWMVPFALFALVITWIIMDNPPPEL